MLKTKWLTILWLMATGCNLNEQPVQDQAKQEGVDSLQAVKEEFQRQGTQPFTDTIAFDVAFSQFLAALQASDTITINQFIHPEHGLWIIEQPGAMPKMTPVFDITRFKREYQDRSFFTVREEVKKCDLQAKAWPTFDCAAMDYESGKSGYSQDGCFVNGPGKFMNSGYWDYANLAEADIKRIKSSLPHIQRSVLHTETSFEFHFGYSEGQWRLLFAKLIYPCSA